MSKATEILILPLAGLMLNRLSSEATTLTILANTDIKTDKLWAKLLITPKQNSRLMTQTQERAVQPIRYDIPASLWARLRGKSPATAESAAKEAFSNGQSDQITTQITGADQLVVSIDFSGAFLAYHAALDRLEEPREKRLPRRERRRDPATDRH